MFGKSLLTCQHEWGHPDRNPYKRVCTKCGEEQWMFENPPWSKDPRFVWKKMFREIPRPKRRAPWHCRLYKFVAGFFVMAPLDGAMAWEQGFSLLHNPYPKKSLAYETWETDWLACDIWK